MLGEGMCRTSGELVPGYQLSLESIRLHLLDEIPLDVRHHGRGQLAWLVKQESNLNVIVVPPKTVNKFNAVESRAHRLLVDV